MYSQVYSLIIIVIIFLFIQFPDAYKTNMNTYVIYIFNTEVCQTYERLTYSQRKSAFVTLCIQGWDGFELYYLGDNREQRLKCECRFNLEDK